MIPAPSKPAADEFWTPRRFLLVLSATVFALFPKVALGLNTFFFRDFGTLGYPGGNYFRESVLHGEFPLWNAYSHCGAPFMAQMGNWYLPSWICVILPMPWSQTFPMLLHLILGGFGMYWLVRCWGVGNFAASLAGFAYAFNGISLTCFQWGNYLASFGWLPWVVLCVMAAWKNGGRWIVLAALTSALQVLTATPELTLLGWFFIGLVWLTAVISGELKFWPSAGRVATVVLIASGIVMVQILPFVDLLQHSQRDTNYDQLRWAMPGWGWANLLVPLFHFFESPQGIWYQQDQEFFLSYYLGAGVLALAVAGALWIRKRLTVVTTMTILFCWIMALGNEGHLYTWVKKIFPYIGIARFPIKFTALTAFLVPLLAAWGIQRLQADRDKHLRRVLIGIGVVMLALMSVLVWFAWQYPYYGDVPRVTTINTVWRVAFLVIFLGGVLWLVQTKSALTQLTLQFLLLGIIVTDAWTHNAGMLPTLPASALRPGVWVEDGRPPLKPGEGRAMISPDAEARISNLNIGLMDRDFIGRRLAEWSNLNLLDMVPKVTGAQTLRPGHFDRVEEYLYRTYGTDYSTGFLDFLSTAWFSSPENPVDWTPRTNFLPVMTAGQRPIFLDDEKSMTALTSNDFNPRVVVYLPESERALVTVSNQTTCTLHDVRFGQNRIEADVDAAQPSLVVLSQTFYHLWHAEVDGKVVPLLRANVAFQALQVPAGQHHVELVYRDFNLKIGAMISVVSILICGVVWFRSRPLSQPGEKKFDAISPHS